MTAFAAFLNKINTLKRAEVTGFTPVLHTSRRMAQSRIWHQTTLIGYMDRRENNFVIDRDWWDPAKNQ